MKKKFLLVDDDNLAHFINRSLLEVSGPADHIYSVNNGKEAIHYITTTYATKQVVPDIIFLDIICRS